MRHHPEHIALLVHDARDGAHGPIRAPPLVGVTETTEVAEDHTPFALQPIDGFGVRGVTAVAMRDRHQRCRAVLVAIAKNRIGGSDTKSYEFTDVFQTFIAKERAGKQSSLARDLEAIADPDHRSALLRERDDVVHDR